MENKNKNNEEEESRIVDIPGVEDRVIRNESDDENKVILNDVPVDAENAVPPEAWENQHKAYKDAWENNKNQMIDDDM